MQYMWRNQLGDIYSLGLGSAACLGAATATMTGWCSLTVGAFICQAICTLIVGIVTLKISTSRLITFGIIFGTFIGSLGTIVVTNAPTGDLLKQYYLWGAANFNLEGVTTLDIIVSLGLFTGGIVTALAAADPLTRHFKEEIELSNLAKSGILCMISLLVTSVVSICGTVGFVSLAIPNLSRVISKSKDIRDQFLFAFIFMCMSLKQLIGGQIGNTLEQNDTVRRDLRFTDVKRFLKSREIFPFSHPAMF